ncbi:hypothetical protein KUH03_05495 [Sphingobacterium sp. E70]|uniref:hypothetical protein n=1 Tax=Sphingobacterium sp. E70 TaxID=2853439 RepID=UPI00211C4B2D|nr:hypothetical protein [Sphingobacterium sp. E70]ULT26362.1 hypothetical protein KUH03_05495 [Sphingobacterium sp. E70]
MTDTKTNATQSLSPASIQLDKLNSNILYMGLEIKPKYLLGPTNKYFPLIFAIFVRLYPEVYPKHFLNLFAYIPCQSQHHLKLVIPKDASFGLGNRSKIGP